MRTCTRLIEGERTCDEPDRAAQSASDHDPFGTRGGIAAPTCDRRAQPGRDHEEALEYMASQRRTIAQALAPPAPLDFEWEPGRAQIATPAVDFSD